MLYEYRKFYKCYFICHVMEEKIVISKEEFEEYQRLKHMQGVDQELLADIAAGIKDILNGNIEEV
ncbi:MAG: hypothetical protein RL557_404 [archaeon]